MKKNIFIALLMISSSCAYFLLKQTNKKHSKKPSSIARGIASDPGENETEQQCNGNRLRSNDPTAVFAWLRNSGANKSVEDILCCMPEELRQNYKIVHSSISAQSSHYHSPRLIFGSIEDGIMFSVSSGDPSLPQSESIEIMYDNPRTQRLELHDIEFEDDGSGRLHPSRPNPELCMQCHRGSGPGGPRPIFNQEPWPRTASIFIRNDPNCPSRSAFLRQSQEAAFTSVRENPRFSCLPEPITEIPVSEAAERSASKSTNLVGFGIDDELNERNQERALIDMRYSENYSAVNYFVIGVSLGCFSNSVPGSKGTQITFQHGQLDEWLSPTLLEQMNRQPPGLNEAFSGPANTELAANSFRQADQTYRANLAAEETTFEQFSRQLANGERPIMSNTMGLMGCIENHSPETFQNLAALSSQIENDSLRQHYLNTAETRLERGFLSTSNDGGGQVFRDSLLTWAFESRGIDTRRWDMEVVPFNPRSLVGTVLRHPAAQSAQAEIDNGTPLSAVCSNLRARSLVASNRLFPTLIEEEAPSNSIDGAE